MTNVCKHVTCAMHRTKLSTSVTTKYFVKIIPECVFTKTEYNLTIMEEALCSLRLFRKIPFTLEISPEYPLLNNRTVKHITDQTIERHSMTNFIANEPDDSTWFWRCNHGIYVRQWLGNNNFSEQMLLSTELLW